MENSLKLEISSALLGLNEDFKKSHNISTSKDVVFHYVREVLKKYNISSEIGIEILKDMKGAYSPKMKENIIPEIINYLKEMVEVNFSDKNDRLTNSVEFRFQNNFDGVESQKVLEYFQENLVTKHNYITMEKLHEFIKLAFEVNEIPENKIGINNLINKQIIIRIFYKYYKEIALKPSGEQKKYARLLGEYFIGFKTDNVSTNFTK